MVSTEVVDKRDTFKFEIVRNYHDLSSNQVSLWVYIS